MITSVRHHIRHKKNKIIPVRRHNRVYYTYLTPKGYRSKYSRDFSTAHAAMTDARRRQKEGKIVQATFWDRTNIIDHRIIGGLDTKGKFKGRTYT